MELLIKLAVIITLWAIVWIAVSINWIARELNYLNKLLSKILVKDENRKEIE